MEHPHHQPTSELAQDNHRQSEQLASGMPNFRKRKRTLNSANPKRTVTGPKQRDWAEGETSALLRFVNLPEFRHQRRTRSKKTHWELIVEAIQGELGASPAITVKRCKERMKTLTGDRYYRLVTSSWERMQIENDNLTEDDLRKLIESCGLTVAWYEAIKEYKAIQAPCNGQGRFRMQMQCDLDQNLTPDRPSSSCSPQVNDDPAEPIRTTSPQNGGKSDREKTAKRFNSLIDSQRSTLLDLVFGVDFFSKRNEAYGDGVDYGSLSNLCEWLSIVQNRRESAIYEDVVALGKMGLVSTWQSDDEMGEGSNDHGWVTSEVYLDFSSLRVYEKLVKKAMIRNPAYDTRRRIQDDAMVTFDATCAPLGITVLNLYDCEHLEVVDLSGFRKLRFLSIWGCLKLREMIGCERAEELGRLEIFDCRSYHGYPPLQKIPSLQDFRFWPCYGSLPRPSGGELDVRGCVRLRVLEIVDDNALSSIRGLEGLRSLIRLQIWRCYTLRSLPNIGHMKDLTHLSICSAVEEIKGVEELSSLKELDCSSSKLKTLPDLSHLPHLKSVELDRCPVVNNPSSPFYKQSRKTFNRENRHVDVSDSSDNE